MQLFYNPNIIDTTEEVTFDKEESRHISKVLRMNVGHTLKITNGKGPFFNAEIVNANPKGCVVKILSEEIQKPLPYHLHLVVSPTKLNDRYEWFLEKDTEMGVSEITPVICDHSERKVIKTERYEKILLSAMKQSLKGYLSVLNEAVSFRDFLISRSEEHTSELQSRPHLVCRLLLEKKKTNTVLFSANNPSVFSNVLTIIIHDYSAYPMFSCSE